MFLLGTIGEIITNLDSYLEILLSNLGMWGVFFSCILITVESILPMLPLCVFVTMLFLAFGNVLGFIISWLCTCLGCFISFTIFRSTVKGWFEKKLVNKKVGKQVKKIMKWIDGISLQGLAVLVAIPFTPAFAVNIAAGLSDISKKKFIAGILIGKAFMVYFWGYIGTTLIESFTHPIYLVRILILMLLAYGVSKLINKYVDIE